MGMTNDGLSYWQADTDSEPLFELTIGDLLDRRADEIPAQEAVVYSCYPEFSGALDIRWSYAVFRERVNAVARGLMALGLQKGEHIAVWAANLPEWVLLESLNLSPFVGGQSGQNTRQIHPSSLCSRWPGLMLPVRSAPPARTHCADESCAVTERTRYTLAD